MKTVSQLLDERARLESQLKGLTSYKSDGTSYFIDEELADKIKGQLNVLNMEIKELGKEIRNVIEEDETREQVLRRSKRGVLESSAKAHYNEQFDQYAKLSFLGKAVAMFTGKKPKRLTDREILETYGHEEVQKLIDERIESILRSKEEQLAIARERYGEDSQEYAYIAQDMEALFEDKVERTKDGFEKELETAIKGSSPRRGR